MRPVVWAWLEATSQKSTPRQAVQSVTSFLTVVIQRPPLARCSGSCRKRFKNQIGSAEVKMTCAGPSSCYSSLRQPDAANHLGEPRIRAEHLHYLVIGVSDRARQEEVAHLIRFLQPLPAFFLIAGACVRLGHHRRPPQLACLIEPLHLAGVHSHRSSCSRLSVGLTQVYGELLKAIKVC